MISDYFEAPWALERMRSGSVGPYMDGFASALAKAGYSPHSIRSYLRAAVHLGHWADRRSIAITSLDNGILIRFRRHFSQCKCIQRNKGVFDGAISGVEQLLAYLRAQHVIAPVKTAEPAHAFAAISERFAAWMLRHRGVVPNTVHRYQLALRPFLSELGEDPAKYDVESIRTFVIEHLGIRSRNETRSAVTAIRAFLRFLVAEGRVPSGIERCVPTVPQWRLSSLPRYLETPDVERVVNSCDLSKGHGLRDHAILLLLARLGLRAGDIVAMTLDDIDWRRSTLRVRGKGRREVLLPLPQDIGDAVLAYLERGRPKSTCDRMFLTVYAPIRPFASSATVSDIVRFALQRAGIQNPPSRGAHLLRHSAATAMLRAGGSLDTIATVLRQHPRQARHDGHGEDALAQDEARLAARSPAHLRHAHAGGDARHPEGRALARSR
jgi:site-specific recombinase XerD